MTSLFLSFVDRLVFLILDSAVEQLLISDFAVEDMSGT